MSHDNALHQDSITFFTLRSCLLVGHDEKDSMGTRGGNQTISSKRGPVINETRIFDLVLDFCLAWSRLGDGF